MHNGYHRHLPYVENRSENTELNANQEENSIFLSFNYFIWYMYAYNDRAVNHKQIINTRLKTDFMKNAMQMHADITYLCFLSRFDSKAFQK